MSNWKVSREEIKLFPHPNADALEVARVGTYSLVVQKGLYRDGDVVVFAPKGSLLPDHLAEPFRNYLAGPEKNRVKEVRLRGEPSQGIVLGDVSVHSLVGEDVSQLLGITEYIPPIPVELQGAVTALSSIEGFSIFKTVEYDVDNYRIYSDEISGGDEVILTEKLHGCVHATTNVIMADGTRKHITLVTPGEHVLGMDENGALTTTEVRNVFTTGKLTKDDVWYNIQVANRRAVRGGGVSKLRVTANHPVWVVEKNDYVRADELTPGDTVLLASKEQSLTYLQREILKGKLLGDGYLDANNQSCTARVTFAHKEGVGYVSWMHDMLRPLVNVTRNRISGYGTTMERGATSMMTDIFNEFYSWVESGKKVFPKGVKLSPISLAVWYMDDGSLGYADGSQRPTANFATNGFDEASVDNILTQLKEQYEIDGVKYESRGWRIRLNYREAEKFFLLIHPYVYEEMSYKLPSYYRGGWKPNFTEEYGRINTHLRETSIVSITHDPHNVGNSSVRWDIETGTSNFFADGILVHNSQLNVLSSGERILVSSKGLLKRGMVLDDSEGNSYWKAARNSGLIEFLKSFSEDVQVVGEMIPCQKGFSYGQKDPTLRVFDFIVNGTSMEYDDVPQPIKDMWVPILYRGPFSEEASEALAKGRETLSGRELHTKEGVVVRPVPARRNSRGSHLILKFINPSYAKKETGEEFN